MVTVHFIRLTVKSLSLTSAMLWLSQNELGRGQDYQQDLATGTCSRQRRG